MSESMIINLPQNQKTLKAIKNTKMPQKTQMIYSTCVRNGSNFHTKLPSHSEYLLNRNTVKSIL